MDGFESMSARELVAALRARRVSARELVQAHLERIDAVNASVNAVVILEPERAMAAAAAADDQAAWSDPAELPPLHGLPLTHKDTHMVAGMRSTSGSRVFADLVPAEDDLIIARLRDAGVIATGKNNVPEFGAGSHTFNDIFGVTTNPYAPDRSAGGSSGGLAAAIAAGIQPMGEGSDMGGSLRIPASFCNIYGLRPSYGVLPMPSPRNNRAWLGRTGPMARTIDDVALFLSAVAGPDPRVQPPAPVTGRDFAALLEEPVGDLRGLRIGWSPDFGIGMPVEPGVLEVLTPLLSMIEAAGATVEEASPDLSEADRVFQVTRATDFASGLGAVVRSHPDLVKREVIWNTELGWSYSAEDLIETTAARTRLDAAVANYFSTYDYLLTPCTQVLPFDATLRYPEAIAGVPSRTYLDWMRSACVISATGLPALALPGGFTGDGLPVGFQLVANHYRDLDLLRAGRVIEERNDTLRRRPDLAGRPPLTATVAPAHHV